MKKVKMTSGKFTFTEPPAEELRLIIIYFAL